MRSRIRAVRIVLRHLAVLAALGPVWLMLPASPGAGAAPPVAPGVRLSIWPPSQLCPYEDRLLGAQLTADVGSQRVGIPGVVVSVSPPTRGSLDQTSAETGPMGLTFFRYRAEEVGTERLTFTATLLDARTGRPVTLRSRSSFRIRECDYFVWVSGEWYLPGYGDRNSHGLNHVVLDSIFGLSRDRQGDITGVGTLFGTEEWYDLNGEVQQDKGSVSIGGEVFESSSGLTLHLRVPMGLRIPASGNTYTPFPQEVTVLTFPPEVRYLNWVETQGVGRSDLIVMLMRHHKD